MFVSAELLICLKQAISVLSLFLQMSRDSDGNKEFHEQLRLQQLYEQKKEGGDDPFTYVDPEDGTVYDWDHEKRAWFPKVFITKQNTTFAQCLFV